MSPVRRTIVAQRPPPPGLGFPGTTWSDTRTLTKQPLRTLRTAKVVRAMVSTPNSESS
jgi:hypothetical protein